MTDRPLSDSLSNPYREGSCCRETWREGALAALSAGGEPQPVARLLTMLELEDALRSDYGPSPMSRTEAVQRKFCEVNGLTVGNTAAAPTQPVEWPENWDGRDKAAFKRAVDGEEAWRQWGREFSTAATPVPPSPAPQGEPSVDALMELVDEHGEACAQEEYCASKFDRVNARRHRDDVDRLTAAIREAAQRLATTPQGQAQAAPAADMPPEIEGRLNLWLTLGKELHPLTVNLVVRFARALAAKLADAEKKYGYSDGWLDPTWMDECRQRLNEHIAKGDPRDVAAYCAFLWHHGQSTTSPSVDIGQAQVLTDGAARKQARDAVKRMNKARDFPSDTDACSRHVALMAETLAKGQPYPMLDEEREHCAISLAITVAMLWEARAALSHQAGQKERT